MSFEVLEKRALLSAAPVSQGLLWSGEIAQSASSLAAEAARLFLPPANISSSVSQAVSGVQVGVSHSVRPLGEIVPGQYSYVIITSSGLAANFQPLINDKIDRGLTATIVTTDYIYANYTGTEGHTKDPMGNAGIEADQIRQFVADAYDHWGTRWVLLGGDASLIPMRKVFASAFGTINYALPTDVYYASPHGTWNGNGNSVWGETTDGPGGGDINLLPEVYVGRAPVSAAGEVANFVGKTIANETSRNANAKTSAWLSCLFDSNTDGKVSNEQIISQVLPADWTSAGLTRYETSSISWTSPEEADVVGILNTGPTLVNSVGHSSATYDSAITSADIAGLTNSFPYFMYSQGCNSGAIEQADPSIAEEQVVASHGALGVVMNTDQGWYSPGAIPAYSHDYNQAFWNAVFKNGEIHPAQANENSKYFVFSQFSTSDIYRWIFFETTLYGDPETPLQVGVTGEVRGSVWNDLNQNGLHDPAEPGLPGQTVFVDLNHNGSYDSSTANLPSSDTPQSIPGAGTFTSRIIASNLSGVLNNVNVTLNITYPYDIDLTATLISPTGTRVELFHGVGGFSGNFTNTTLDDQATSWIYLGTAPFTGVYRPTNALAVLNGQQPNGAWTLEITDAYGFGAGTLNSWSLHIASAEPSAVTGTDGTYDIPNLPDGNFQVRHVPQSGWTDTNPTSSLQQVTIANGAIVSSVDFLTSQAKTNQPPVLSGIEGTSQFCTANGPATAITSAITASDADNPTLAGATVWISGNYQSGQDVLSFVNTANITGVWMAAMGTLTLSGSDTLANYQADLRAVKYQNTSLNPSTAPRNVSFKANDGLADSNVVTRNINVNPAIALGTPSLRADTVNLAYNQTITATGGTGTTTLAVTNIQNAIPGLAVPTSGSGSLNITGTPTAAGIETFTVTATDTLGAMVSVNYSITVNAAVSIGPPSLPADTISVAYNQMLTTSGGTGTTTLAVTNIQNPIPGLNVPTSGSGSLNITGTPTAVGMETFTVTATDLLGATTAINYSITVNSPPVLAGMETTALTYTQGDPAAAVTSSIAVNDADIATLAGATVWISGNYQSGEDLLSFPNTANITSIWMPATGSLVLSGNATLADYQAALRMVTYQDTSSSPNASTRTVSFTVSDGLANSNALTRQITITPVAVWNGNATGSLSDPANWVNGAAPDPAFDILVLGGPAVTTPQNDFLDSSSFHNLTLNGNCALSGNLALLQSTVINDHGSNSLLLPIALGNDVIVSILSGSLAVGGTIDNGGHLLTVNTAASTTAAISRSISGSGGLVKSGLGTLVLSAQNSYSGGTTVASGLVQVTSPDALADGSSLTVGKAAAFLASQGLNVSRQALTAKEVVAAPAEFRVAAWASRAIPAGTGVASAAEKSGPKVLRPGVACADFSNSFSTDQQTRRPANLIPALVDLVLTGRDT